MLASSSWLLSFVYPPLIPKGTRGKRARRRRTRPIGRVRKSDRHGVPAPDPGRARARPLPPFALLAASPDDPDRDRRCQKKRASFAKPGLRSGGAVARSGSRLVCGSGGAAQDRRDPRLIVARRKGKSRLRT